MARDIYDVAIVGSGIGGLVCGCYLAKNGKKVLVFEKNDHPGGCCVTFERSGFRFDSMAHSLGGINHGGPLGSLFEDLGIEIAKLNIERTDPSYIVLIGDYALNIWNDFNKTLFQLKKDFKNEEKQIDDFFTFVRTATFISLVRIRNICFQDLLDRYFSDVKLKTVLCAPLLGNTGTNPLRISSFTAVKFYQQYVLDGGYHFRAGMQSLPNSLVEKLQQFGGEIMLRSEVDKILVKRNKAVGVKIKNKIFDAKIIVSDIDTRRTFLELIGKEKLQDEFLGFLQQLRLSHSMYICHIGMKDVLSAELVPEITHWFISDLSIEKIYNNIEDCKLTFDWLAIRLSKDKKSIQIFSIAPVMDKTYWRIHDLEWKEALLKRVADIIPGFSSSSPIFSFVINPRTIMQWTANNGGAICGWENTPDQFSVSGLSQKTMIENLYFTGHWATLAFGIPGVVNIGMSTAKMICAI